MKKEIIATDKAPAAIGPYSQGVKAGDYVFSSGQLPLDPATKKIPESIKEQTKVALSNVKAVLEEAGTSLDKVIKTTVFLADISYFAEMNEVYSTFFKAPFPARSAFAVKELPLGAKLEIEVIAIV